MRCGKFTPLWRCGSFSKFPTPGNVHNHGGEHSDEGSLGGKLAPENSIALTVITYVNTECRKPVTVSPIPTFPAPMPSIFMWSEQHRDQRRDSNCQKGSPHQCSRFVLRDLASALQAHSRFTEH
jgi:hypothetical protein